jgi:hypothetical protein
MRVLHAALAVGALTLSVPVFAQGNRYGFDRSRVERGRETRRDDRRPRTDDRFDRRDDRQKRRGDIRYERRDSDYRYDRERGLRDRIVIAGWFRGYGALRLSLRDRVYHRERYDFRPGFYLSPVIFARLDILPFDLALRLGPLPWYCERRVYGRSVLIIDTRSRMIVDVYDIDW